MEMYTYIGNVISKNSGLSYQIAWDEESQTIWEIKTSESTGSHFYLQIGYNAKTKNDALSVAQEYIDSQPGLY